MEIIGTGYGKEIEIGESYIKENVINMWDFAPKGAYVYYRNGFTFTLMEYTKTSSSLYKTRTLMINEITEEIKEALENKYK